MWGRIGTLAIAIVHVASSADCRGLTVIHDVKDISAEEKAELVRGMQEMKRIPSQFDPTFNAWDYFVDLHLRATMPSTQQHAGWGFFPFHREMMNRYVRELQRAANNSKLWFPYWDFADPSSTAALMDLTYIGGKGDPSKGYAVQEGNFAEGIFNVTPELTNLPAEVEHGSLVRCAGFGSQQCLDDHDTHYFLSTCDNPPTVDQQDAVGPFHLMHEDGPPEPNGAYLAPERSNAKCTWTDLGCTRHYTNTTLNLTLRCRHYGAELPKKSDYKRCMERFMPYSSLPVGPGNSSSPWNTSIDYYKPHEEFFRPCFEGVWHEDEFAYGLERIGGALHPPHGASHTYMGGSLSAPTAPNDPIFLHLHWNVDRLWAEYQARYGSDGFFDTNSEEAESILESALPAFPEVKVRDTLSASSYGYTFDTLCDDLLELYV